jgi:hypothetical protein
MLMITGTGGPPVGRNTSAASAMPSAIGISTSRSTTIAAPLAVSAAAVTAPPGCRVR